MKIIKLPHLATVANAVADSSEEVTNSNLNVSNSADTTTSVGSTSIGTAGSKYADLYNKVMELEMNLNRYHDKLEKSNDVSTESLVDSLSDSVREIKRDLMVEVIKEKEKKSKTNKAPRMPRTKCLEPETPVASPLLKQVKGSDKNGYEKSQDAEAEKVKHVVVTSKLFLEGKKNQETQTLPKKIRELDLSSRNNENEDRNTKTKKVHFQENIEASPESNRYRDKVKNSPAKYEKLEGECKEERKNNLPKTARNGSSEKHKPTTKLLYERSTELKYSASPASLISEETQGVYVEPCKKGRCKDAVNTETERNMAGQKHKAIKDSKPMKEIHYGKASPKPNSSRNIEASPETNRNRDTMKNSPTFTVRQDQDESKKSEGERNARDRIGHVSAARNLNLKKYVPGPIPSFKRSAKLNDSKSLANQMPKEGQGYNMKTGNKKGSDDAADKKRAQKKAAQKPERVTAGKELVTQEVNESYEQTKPNAKNERLCESWQLGSCWKSLNMKFEMRNCRARLEIERQSSKKQTRITGAKTTRKNGETGEKVEYFQSKPCQDVNADLKDSAKQDWHTTNCKDNSARHSPKTRCEPDKYRTVFRNDSADIAGKENGGKDIPPSKKKAKYEYVADKRLPKSGRSDRNKFNIEHRDSKDDDPYLYVSSPPVKVKKAVNDKNMVIMEIRYPLDH